MRNCRVFALGARQARRQPVRHAHGGTARGLPMRSLSLAVRAYLWGAGLACVALVVGECLRPGAWIAARHDPSLLLQAAIFVVLAYAGARTALRINEFVDQTLATPVHVAAILLFPRPLPLLIALLAVMLSQLLHVRLPLYKRLFN